jgi:predicted kinase
VATVHLLCGFLGAGKTTFATTLAARVRGVRFSVDELYLRLFATGPTYDLDRAALERLFRVLDELWPQVVGAGVDVVLDFGFWRRAERDAVRERARAAGADTVLHWLCCSDEVAVARCLARNGSPGAFLISEEGYWELKSRFEPPGPDERCALVET